MSLENFFNTLIAEELTRQNPEYPMRPEDVTLEFICQDRERRFYPHALYYGEETEGLLVLSRVQLEDIEREVDEFFKGFRVP